MVDFTTLEGECDVLAAIFRINFQIVLIRRCVMLSRF